MDTMENLDDLNYENWITWRNSFQCFLAGLDVDSALEEDEPTKPTLTSSPEEKAIYEKWERSNSLCLLLMKQKMAESVYGFLRCMTNSGNAKEMFDALKESIIADERIRAPSMLDEVVNMRYDGKGDVSQHLGKMYRLVTRLKTVDVGLPEYLINRLALDSLPSEFEPVKLGYLMKKEKWEFHEIVARCAEVEEWIRQENKLQQIQIGYGTNKRRNAVCHGCGQKGHIAKYCRMS